MPKIVVEGPDGRKFAFPDTMPRAEINAFMKQKYGTKARDESVQDYLARYGREQAATEARVKDIDREATAVGRAEGERAAERMGVTNPLMMAVAAPAIGLAQQEGGRRVFEREGTVLADEAAGLSAINAAGFFVPGMVNREFGAQLEEGRRQQPLAAFAGDVAGGFGPGEIIGAGVAKAAQSIGPGFAALGRMLSRGPGPDAAPTAMPDAMPAGGYFGRKSMRPPGSGPSPREIEIRQKWSTATPIVTQARTTAQTAQQAAESALQSKAPADIARAKDAKKTLVGQLQEAQASRAGMNTPEDARLSETLASLTENTSDPVLLSTQISAAKTSLDRLLTDIGSPVEGNLIPVRTQILTRTQAPRSAAEGPQDRASVTRYAEGGDEIKPQGFGAGGSKVNRLIDVDLLDEIENYTPPVLDDLEIPMGGQTVSILLPSGSKVSEQFPSHDLMADAMTGGKIKNLWELGQKTGLIRISGDDSGYEIFNGVTSSQKRAIMRHYDQTEFLNVELFDGQNWIGGTFREGDKSKLAAFLEGNKTTSAASPISPMGFGASTPKPPQQAGLTSERELGSKMQRDKKD